jgi:hypothetical protein
MKGLATMHDKAFKPGRRRIMQRIDENAPEAAVKAKVQRRSVPVKTDQVAGDAAVTPGQKMLALQRTVGNRAMQAKVGVLQRDKPKEKQKEAPKAEPPPPGGTIAEGDPLDQAMIKAVKAALASLPKGATKRYIVYKDVVKVGGTLAWRANNPGNLRDASSKIASVSGAVGNFAVFASMEEGREAQKNLYLNRYGDMKVRDAVAKLTPDSENDTRQYLKDLEAQAVKLDEKVKPQIDQFMEAVRKNEGMKAGIEVSRTPEQSQAPAQSTGK